ncbi:hypothetical protein HK102_011135 [Quaeritorhiza haematococci]|nr:hypothetical protein HK102_011135 [Quaeritorhiza haematococci]
MGDDTQQDTSEVSKLVEHPRPYQIELYEKARQQNIIAYLDTGSGKTLVSVLLIQEIASPLVEVSRHEILKLIREQRLQLASTSPQHSAVQSNQSQNEGENASAGSKDTAEEAQNNDGVTKDGEETTTSLKRKTITMDMIADLPLAVQPKKIVFLVPTVPLVAQQAEKIRRNTDLRVGEYSRDDNSSVAYWDSVGWYHEMSKRQVLVLTPQIFLNILRHGFMNLGKNVSLLIFDECHHAVGNHAYNNIMKEFYAPIPGGDERPKIFGMTASPIYQKATTRDASLEKMLELQRNLNCVVVTVADRSTLRGYVAKAVEVMVEYELAPTNDEGGSNSFNVNTASDGAGMDSSTTLPNLKDTPAGRYLIHHYGKILDSLALAEANKEKAKIDEIKKTVNLVKQMYNDLGSWCAGKIADLYANDPLQGGGHQHGRNYYGKRKRGDFQSNYRSYKRPRLQNEGQGGKAFESTNIASDNAVITDQNGVAETSWEVKSASQIADSSPSSSTFESSVPAPPPPTPEQITEDDFTPKVRTLLRLIEERVKGNPPGHGGILNTWKEATTPENFRAMVFVERRTTAKALSELINLVAGQRFPLVKCGCVTGHGTASAGRTGEKRTGMKMNSTMQKKIFQRFRAGEMNMMVVTRVAEEGVDIPACRLVIIFDLFRSHTGYVQSRGRARHVDGSEYIILVRRNDTHALQYLARAKVAELMTRSVAKDASTTEPSSSSGDVAAADDDVNDKSNRVVKGEHDNEIVDLLLGSAGDQPVVTPAGARATVTSAVQILHRYCQSLKKDQYLTDGQAQYNCLIEARTSGWEEWDAYLEMWRDQCAGRLRGAEEKDKGKSTANIAQDPPSDLHHGRFAKSPYGYAFEVRIPFVSNSANSSSSTVISVVGSVRLTKKLAMQSASLEAIRYLYKSGALDDHLLPTNRSLKKSKSFSLLSLLRSAGVNVTDKVLQGLGIGGDGNTRPRRLLGASAGAIVEQLKEEVLDEYRRDVPRVFVNDELWKGLVDSDAHGWGLKRPALSLATPEAKVSAEPSIPVADATATSAPLVSPRPSLTEYVDVYITIISCGPQLELFTRGSDPPANPFYNLFNPPLFPFPVSPYTNHYYHYPNPNYYALSPTGEPRRSLAIVTRRPIPAKSIPPFCVWLDNEIPCKVEVLSWWEGKGKDGEEDGKSGVGFGGNSADGVSGTSAEDSRSNPATPKKKKKVSGTDSSPNKEAPPSSKRTTEDHSASLSAEYHSVRLTRAQFDQLVDFQKKFWDLIVRRPPPNQPLLVARNVLAKKEHGAVKPGTEVARDGEGKDVGHESAKFPGSANGKAVDKSSPVVKEEKKEGPASSAESTKPRTKAGGSEAFSSGADDATTSGDVPIEPDPRTYLVMPVVGYPLPPDLKRGRYQHLSYSDSIPRLQTPKKRCPEISELPDPPRCTWELDWDMVNRVLEGVSFTLYEWIEAVGGIAQDLAKGSKYDVSASKGDQEEKAKKRRMSGDDPSEFGLFDDDDLMGLDDFDDSPLYDMEFDDPEDFDLDVEEDDGLGGTKLSGSSGSPGDESDSGSSSDDGDEDVPQVAGKKRKRSDTAATNNHAARDTGRQTGGTSREKKPTPSFDMLFEKVLKKTGGDARDGGRGAAMKAGDVTTAEQEDAVNSEGEDTTKYSGVVLEKVNHILAHTVVHTRHNNIKYNLHQLLPSIQPCSDFAASRFKDDGSGKLLTYQSYVEQLGYTVAHPRSAMVEAQHAPSLRNMLKPRNVKKGDSQVPGSKRSQKSNKVLLVPDVCKVLPFPAETFRTANVFPSILHKLDLFCMVDQYRVSNGLPLVTNQTLFSAFAAPSAHEHTNYERLETLGDSFLKYACSVDLYLRYPDAGEGALSSMRAKNVSNRNLYEKALGNGYGGLLIVTPFYPKLWAPPACIPWTPFRQHQQQRKQRAGGSEMIVRNAPLIDDDENADPYRSKKGIWWRLISQKMLADFVEALIGAHYTDGGNDLAMRALYKLGLVSDFMFGGRGAGGVDIVSAEERLQPLKIDQHMNDSRNVVWRNAGDENKPSANLVSPSETKELKNRNGGEAREQEKMGSGTPSSSAGVEKSVVVKMRSQLTTVAVDMLLRHEQFPLDRLEQTLSYKFRNRDYALEAFTHASYPYATTRCYQRLEFLGDAVLDWVLTRFLYNSYSWLAPGQLTELRQAAVNNESFCRMTVSLGFHKYLLHNSALLTRDINEYVDYLENRDTAMHPTETSHEGPKVLGDLFEACAGAVYVDSGCDLETMWKVFRPLMDDFLEEHVNPNVVTKSPIRLLHEYFQKRGFAVNDVSYKYVEYPDTNLFTSDLMVFGEIISQGRGNSKIVAKRQATLQGLQWIEGHQEEIARLLDLSRKERYLPPLENKASVAKQTNTATDVDKPARDVPKESTGGDSGVQKMEQVVGSSSSGDGGDGMFQPTTEIESKVHGRQMKLEDKPVDGDEGKKQDFHRSVALPSFKKKKPEGEHQKKEGEAKSMNAKDPALVPNEASKPKATNPPPILDAFSYEGGRYSTREKVVEFRGDSNNTHDSKETNVGGRDNHNKSSQQNTRQSSHFEKAKPSNNTSRSNNAKPQHSRCRDSGRPHGNGRNAPGEERSGWKSSRANPWPSNPSSNAPSNPSFPQVMNPTAPTDNATGMNNPHFTYPGSYDNSVGTTHYSAAPQQSHAVSYPPPPPMHPYGQAPPTLPPPPPPTQAISAYQYQYDAYGYAHPQQAYLPPHQYPQEPTPTYQQYQQQISSTAAPTYTYPYPAGTPYMQAPPPQMSDGSAGQVGTWGSWGVAGGSNQGERNRNDRGQKRKGKGGRGNHRGGHHKK